MKFFEIRDRATFIPVFAFRARCQSGLEAERYLLSRAGYGPCNDSQCVMLGRLEGGGCNHDPFDWGGSRTMQAAHLYLEGHYDDLAPGAVIDVEFILGETATPKVSERIEWPDVFPE
jgi:hypothetical protein